MRTEPMPRPQQFNELHDRPVKYCNARKTEGSDNQFDSYMNNDCFRFGPFESAESRYFRHMPHGN